MSLIDTEGITETIASSTTNYIFEFRSIFFLVAGLIFAVFLIQIIIDLFIDWLDNREILSEYGDLLEQESSLLGKTYDPSNVKNDFYRDLTNKSIETTTLDDEIEIIKKRKSDILSKYRS